MAGILDAWANHAKTTAAMRGKTGLDVIPNYGFQSGADFQMNFPNLDPRVTSVLASGYQLGQEGLRALNPFGNNFLDFKGAYRTAAEQAAENIRGAVFANQNVLSPEELALNQKYAERTLGDKNVYSNPKQVEDKSLFQSFEDMIFSPAYGDIPTLAEKQAVEKNIEGFDYNFNSDVLKEEEDAQYNLDNKRSLDFSGIMQNLSNYAKDAAGRYIGSQALGGAGAMLLGPIGGLVGGIAGLLKGGDLFNSPYIGAGAYTMDQYGNMYTADQLDKMNARGGYYTDVARQSRLRDQSIRRMEERKAQGLQYGINRLEQLKEQQRQEEAARQSAARSMQEQNQASGTGGYQSSWGSVDSFMSGSGTAADMGSF
jgi:hypothetical protein